MNWHLFFISIASFSFSMLSIYVGYVIGKWENYTKSQDNLYADFINFSNVTKIDHKILSELFKYLLKQNVKRRLKRL